MGCAPFWRCLISFCDTVVTALPPLLAWGHHWPNLVARHACIFLFQFLARYLADFAQDLCEALSASLSVVPPKHSSNELAFCIAHSPRVPFGAMAKGAKPLLAKSKAGAKKRATVALMGKKFSEAMTPEQMFAFWSARTKVAPPLRTSFGNFTLLNSVDRSTIDTSTTLDRIVWIPWTASPLAKLYAEDGGASTGFDQTTYSTLVGTSSPQYIRPLRMSFQLENITAMLNVAGSVRVYSLDNPIVLSGVCGATTVVPVNFVNPFTILKPLINDAPDTIEITGHDLTTEREYVCPPCSYPAYNSYYEFNDMNVPTDNVRLTSGDWQSLIAGTDVTYVPTVSRTSGAETGALGGLPPVRGFLLLLPPTPVANSYRLTVRRQDGCRYPVNSLGAAFARVHPKAEAKGEDTLIKCITSVTNAPAQSFPSQVVSALGNVVNSMAAGMTSNADEMIRNLDYAHTIYNALGGSAALMNGMKVAKVLL